MGEWYYIGHYGQLGPLTQSQFDELIAGDVIARDTYVWKVGMASWIQAGLVAELRVQFDALGPDVSPPPPPGAMKAAPPPRPSLPPPSLSEAPSVYSSYPPVFVTIKSDKSRILGGVLQILFPFGIGRMYLGHVAIGVIQLLLFPCGIGIVWSLVDGIFILAGGLKIDGYGRTLGN